MAIDISAIAYAFQQQCKSASLPLKAGQVQQLMAAALGYKTLAAYQAAIAAGTELVHLDTAAHLVLSCDSLKERAHQLGHSAIAPSLVGLTKLVFQQCLSTTRVHSSETNFFVHLQEQLEAAVEFDEQTLSEMALTNGDGVDEVYVPVDVTLASLPHARSQVTLDIEGHVAMSLDSERPYAGHIIQIQACVSFDRLGYALFSDADYSVREAKLDYDWAEDDDTGPKITFAEAIADLTGLTPAESEMLVDVEPLDVVGNDDMVYGHILDFTNVAPPELAKKLMARHGQLDFRVSLNFFDQVQMR